MTNKYPSHEPNLLDPVPLDVALHELPDRDDQNYGYNDSKSESYLQPNIEGLRIVGIIDLDRISALHSTRGRELWVIPGQQPPDELKPIASLVKDTVAVYPEDSINVSVTKTHFDPQADDPFHARFLADMMHEAPANPVHRDEESLLTRLVCDSNPTVFYPTKENGQADMSQAWQPMPGEVVEFTSQVWHSPPLKVEGSGLRTLLTLRIGIGYL